MIDVNFDKRKYLVLLHLIVVYSNNIDYTNNILLILVEDATEEEDEDDKECESCQIYLWFLLFFSM